MEHQTTQDPAAKLAEILSPAKRDFSFVESLLLGSRYLLVPMFIGLILSMLAYNYAFLCELWSLGGSLFHHHEELKEFLLVSTLSLLDMAMIANLIIMIMIGSYSIFVSEIHAKKLGDKMPRFLIGLTSGMLKIKMGASLVSVSSIHLLTMFMNTAHTDWDDLLKKILIHVMFIVAAVYFAKIEVMTHPPAPNDSH